MLHIHEYQGAQGTPLRYGKLVDPKRPTGGKALLFVPGLGGSVKGALDFLEQLLPQYSPIYGPDLRGFGLNPLEEPLGNIKIVQEDLEAFYQQVIAPANHSELLLCGISLGGVLATLMAARSPDRYSGLVLLAPAYKPHSKSFSLGYTVRNLLAYLLKGNNARTQLPYDISAVTSNEEVLKDPQYTENPPLVLTPGFLLSVRSLCNQAFSEASGLALPTLMVIPGQDIVCDPAAMQRAFGRIPEQTMKRCKEYPDFYHDVLFEAGHSEIAQEIVDWFASEASRSASLSS